MLPFLMAGQLARPELQQALDQYGAFPWARRLGMARDAFMQSPMSRMGNRGGGTDTPMQPPGPPTGIDRYKGGPVSAYAYAKSQGWI